ncbi:MAG TPA: hypothetical protein VFW42_07845 [Fluviicoccus sp.]|nr:hypothetical protein [Fluviicoccus sp.]
MLTREELLAAPFRFEDVTTPRGVVRVRTMSAAARERFEAAMAGERKADLESIRAQWVSVCCCDEAGSPLFGQDDVPALALLDYSIIAPLFTAALRLNGMGENAVEEAEKN